MSIRFKESALTVPWGLLGMLALVIAVEATVVAAADRLASYDGLGVRFAADAATNKASGCDVLALGDSMLKFGFDPGAIEARLGLKAYNLAVAGTPPPLTYALFRRALAAGARPKAIVVGPMTLSGDVRVHIAQLGECVGLGECVELAWSCRDSTVFAKLIAARILPSWRYRPALNAALCDRVPTASASRKRRQIWTSLRGAELQAPDAPFDGTLNPTLAAGMCFRPWRVDGIFERYHRRLIALAQTRGIAVIWVVAPIVPEAQARRDALGLDALHTRNIRSIQAQVPGVVVLDARHAGYVDADFFDSIHLNAQGAAKLSTAVAEAIAERLGQRHGPDWREVARRD